MTFAVVGAGSWGTGIAVLLARNGHAVHLITRDPAHADRLATTRENGEYLPGHTIPDPVTFGLIGDAVEAEIWVLATPSAAIGEVARGLHASARHIVLASKGLEPQTGRLLSDVLADSHPEAEIGALSGPNLAREIMDGIPTATLSASPNEAAAEEFCRAISSRTFRAYYTDDLVGVELAGALKNVLALGAGMSDGLGFGDNTKGALLARGLKEMATLGQAMGARIETFFGIAGVGDLFATAHSRLSRNYRVGEGLGQGKSLQQVLDEVQQTAEGVATSAVVDVLADRHGVEMPIHSTIHKVVEGKIHPREAVGLLMDRAPQKERIGRPETTVL